MQLWRTRGVSRIKEQQKIMRSYPDKNSSLASWPWWRIAVTALSTLAFVLSLVMSWHYLTGGSMAGCDGGSPCNQVLSNKWSTIAGILPVSGLAVGIYLALGISAFFIGHDTEISVRKLAYQVMLILSGTIAGSAIWFTAIQKWLIGEFCPYCMATHTTGFLLATLIIWKAFKEFGGLSDSSSIRKKETQIENMPLPQTKQISGRYQTLKLAFVGLGLAGILAVFQVIITPSSSYRGGEAQENVITIDYKSAPLIGSPDAPYIINLLFDYQCPHCQKLHFVLDEVVRRYSGKVAFALCPAPLNTHCNPYIPRDVDAFKNSCELAKIGLAVWNADREAFKTFESWMFTFDSGDRWHPRTLEAAQAKASELIGQKKLDVALSAPWTSQYLQACIQIYGQTIQGGKGGVPKMVLGSRWVIPEVSTADELLPILQTSLGVPKP